MSEDAYAKMLKQRTEDDKIYAFQPSPMSFTSLGYAPVCAPMGPCEQHRMDVMQKMNKDKVHRIIPPYFIHSSKIR